MNIKIIDSMRRILSIFERENRIFKLLIDHNNLSLQAMDKLIRLIDSRNVDECIEYSKQIETLEKDGDDIAYKLTRSILEGAVTLTLQNNFVELVNTLDNILDKIHFLSKEFVRMKKYFLEETIPLSSISYEIYENLLHSRRSIQSLNKILRTAIEGDINKIKEIRDEIEALEEYGDEMKDKTMDHLYSVGKDIPSHLFSLFRSHIFEIDTIEDLCEDAANQLTIILRILSE